MNNMPRVGAPISGPGGQITVEWRNFLLGLASSSNDEGVADELRRIADRVSGLESGQSPDVSILGVDSVRVDGTFQDGVIRIHLLNDSADPGAARYYGTDDSGARGFHALPTSGVLPVVTGEIVSGQPVFVHADDGSLIYTEIA